MGNTDSITKKFVAIIPAFNPGPIVLDVVRSTLDYVDRVVLVDDGSNNENRNYLQQCKEFDTDRVDLISFENNRGKGYALFRGMERCLELGSDYILTIDSDGQHNPDEIPRFKEFVARDDVPFEIVIGTRKQISKMPLRSKFGNVFTAKIFNSLFDASIADTQSGFRLLSADLAKDVLENLAEGKYETEMRMLLYAFETERKVGSMEIETIYLNENANSKFRPIRDSLRVLSAFTKYASVAFVSFLTDYLIFLALTYVLGIYYIYAHVSSRVFSGALNFLLNKHLVFKSKKRHFDQAIKYLLAVVFTLCTTSLLLYFMVEIVGASRALGKPVAEFLMFTLNFFVLRKFVFN